MADSNLLAGVCLRRRNLFFAADTVEGVVPGSDGGGGNTAFAERLGKTARLSRLAVRLVWLVSPGLALGIVALVYVIDRVPWAARVGRRPAATPEKHLTGPRLVVQLICPPLDGPQL